MWHLHQNIFKCGTEELKILEIILYWENIFKLNLKYQKMTRKLQKLRCILNEGDVIVRKIVTTMAMVKSPQWNVKHQVSVQTLNLWTCSWHCSSWSPVSILMTMSSYPPELEILTADKQRFTVADNSRVEDSIKSRILTCHHKPLGFMNYLLRFTQFIYFNSVHLDL